MMQLPAKLHQGAVVQAAQPSTQAAPSAQLPPAPPPEIVAPVTHPQTSMPPAVQPAAGLTAPHSSASAAHTASAAPVPGVVPAPASAPVLVSAPVSLSMPAPQLVLMPAPLLGPTPTAAATTPADSAAAEAESGTISQQELGISPGAADLLADLEIDIHTSDPDKLCKDVVLLANTLVAYQGQVSTVLNAAHDQLLGPRRPQLGSAAAGVKRGAARQVLGIKQELQVPGASKPARRRQQQRATGGTSKAAGLQLLPTASTAALESGGLLLQRIRGPSTYGSKPTVQVWRCVLGDKCYFFPEDAIQLRGTQRTSKALSAVSAWHTSTNVLPAASVDVTQVHA